MELRAKVPGGPIQEKWDRHRFDLKLVSPANKRRYHVVVVGSGAGGSFVASGLAANTDKRILILEKGDFIEPAEFLQRERLMMPRFLDTEFSVNQIFGKEIPTVSTVCATAKLVESNPEMSTKPRSLWTLRLRMLPPPGTLRCHRTIDPLSAIATPPTGSRYGEKSTPGCLTPTSNARV